ncbi:PQQ-binding-like beta-propeller repeat protein [uncultured Bacteroides sp.]|uniref:outer membrane protein assembly factor BamB family protein n=1 Tax=uncultured Bacteroides sp. TaxID=162156 RepID=UPI0025EDB297|nr:PQQ-binding-like beta-propeller repeat protein [uncultured Bacteroides sp.]
MKRVSAILLAILLYLPLNAQFKGTVYMDIDRSGTLDKNDRPLAGVTVTDGLNVVKTDKKGRFSLPGFEKTRFITVTTPAGYETRQFYLPVSEDKKSYDFLLSESERTRSAEHSFVHITDTEVTGGMGRWVTDLKQYIRNEKTAFLIHTGDICYEPGLTMHNQVVNAQTMNCPVYYCIGNHDLVKGNYGEELYESLYGPTWYSFDVGNIHYVVTPIAYGDHRTDYTRRDVYNWLKNDLALMKEGQALILFNHDLFTSGNNFVFKADNEHILDLRAFHTKAQIYGHMHYNYVRNQNGIHTICTGTLDKGGIDHSVSAFRDIRIGADNTVSTELRYAFVEPQVAIVSPMKQQKAATTPQGALVLSANAYHSQAKTKQVYYTLSLAENGGEVAQGTFAPSTNWNWNTRITLPAHLQGKELKLSVTAHFNDGKQATDSNRFFYEGIRQSSVVPGENWNTLLQNAAHTGGNNRSDIRLPLQLNWTANAGSNIFLTSPLIAEGKVFIATTDDNVSPHTHLCAFDIHTGEPIWKYRTANSIKNTIAYEAGVIVAQDAECRLYALDAQTGELLWQQQINLHAYPYLTEGLTISNGTVYAGIGAGLSAYDLKTGNILWTNKDWKQREGSTTTLTVAGNVLISGTQWGGLYANDLKTGKQLWKLSENGLGNRGASPVYQDGKLWILSSRSLFAIDPESGKILTQKELSANLDVTSTPLVTEREIIFGSADHGLMALDKATLFIKWKAETKPSLVYTVPYSTAPQTNVETSPVASHEIVYAGASDGYLYAIEQATGVIKEKYYFGAPIFSTVAVSGNCLVVCDYAGNVYCFSSAN